MFKHKEYCSTCLSEGRNLTPARLFSSFFKGISNKEIEANGGLCWECKSLILKYDRFKHQVEIVQDIMKQKVLNIQPLSKLTHQIKDTYDYIFSYNDSITCTEYEFTVRDLKVESISHIAYDSSVDFKEHIENVDIKINNNSTIERDESVNNIEITKDNTDNEIALGDFKEDIYVENIDFKINDYSPNDVIEVRTAFGREDSVNTNGVVQDYTDNEILIDGFKEDIYVNNIDIKINDHSPNDFNEFNNEILRVDGVNEENGDNKTLTRGKINGTKYTKGLLSRNNPDVVLKNFNRKHNRVRIKKEVHKSPQEEFEEKFESIVLSEEELSRSREEKRNRPNFKKVPYKCDNCVLGFLTKENYDLHLAKKHDEKIGPFACSVCNIRFPFLRSMNNHKNKHYAVYRCKLCKYETVELYSAMNHCKVKHKRDSAGRLHCTQCLSVCKTPQDLEEHMRKEHAFSCNECGVKFKGKDTLRSHKARVHAFKRDYSCELCRKTFKNQSRLESHMAGHESSVARRLAYCSICDVQYKNIYVYRSHLRNSVNHAETLYPCSECDKKFASKVYRTKHYNFYHLQKTKYKCDLCNKLLISAWRLKNHKQKYHGLTRPREHSCNLCEKKFFTLATLRGHVLTHSKERSFMCEDCGDTFKQKPALYTHSRQVHRGGRKVK